QGAVPVRGRGGAPRPAVPRAHPLRSRARRALRPRRALPVRAAAGAGTRGGRRAAGDLRGGSRVKFLCVPCDQPMKLRTTASPESGTLSVVYTCPACDYEIAMLTNPFETQLVQSLGVKIGPEGKAAGSGCPFSGMVAEATSSAEEPGELT